MPDVGTDVLGCAVWARSVKAESAVAMPHGEALEYMEIVEIKMFFFSESVGGGNKGWMMINKNDVIL